MKKLIAILLVAASLLAVLPVCSAQDDGTQAKDVVYYEDGSYLVTVIEDVPSARASNTRTKNKVCTWYNSDDTVAWEITLTATFTFDGTSATCDTAICTASIYDRTWYIISKTASKSGNVAYGNAVLGYKILGVVIDKRPINLTLTCSPTGVFS